MATFYALGDWGEGNKAQKAVADALRKDVDALPHGREVPPFVLGLGDNVYDNGLPPEWGNPKTDFLLDKTFGSIYNNFKYLGAGGDTMVIFHTVAGNHDYDVALKRGFPFDKGGDVFHMETTAEHKYPHFRYYPIHHDNIPSSTHFPVRYDDIPDSNDSLEYAALHDTLDARNVLDVTLPQALELSRQAPLTIVAIDTQVLLDLYQDHDMAQVKRHWRELEKRLKEGQDEGDWTMVIGHHPIATHGRHGGFVPFDEWVLYGPHGIFDAWYGWPPRILAGVLLLSGFTTPAVILAALPPTLNVIDKALVVHPQDTDHPDNQRFQNDLKQILEKYNALYLAGHEHCLELLELGDSLYQIVSGSASKHTPVGHEPDTYFSHEALGFVRFDVTEDALWIGFYEVEVDPTATRTATFRLTR